MSDLEGKIPSKGRVIIAIGDVNACVPCRKLEEFMEKYGKEIGIPFVSIKVSDLEAENPGLKITSIPKIIFMNDGTVVMNYEGFSNGDKFKEIIKMAFQSV